MPPSGERRKIGICEANPTIPSSSDDPVSRYTSHDCAIVCIQVPISEINWPLKKSWKLRCRSARPATCQRDPETVSAPRTAALSRIGILDSGTVVSFDDVTRCSDYYNLHVPRTCRQGQFSTDGRNLCQARSEATRKPLSHHSLPCFTGAPSFVFPDQAGLRYSCTCSCALPGDSLRK